MVRRSASSPEIVTTSGSTVHPAIGTDAGYFALEDLPGDATRRVPGPAPCRVPRRPLARRRDSPVAVLKPGPTGLRAMPGRYEVRPATRAETRNPTLMLGSIDLPLHEIDAVLRWTCLWAGRSPSRVRFKPNKVLDTEWNRTEGRPCKLLTVGSFFSRVVLRNSSSGRPLPPQLNQARKPRCQRGVSRSTRTGTTRATSNFALPRNLSSQRAHLRSRKSPIASIRLPHSIATPALPLAVVAFPQLPFPRAASDVLPHRRGVTRFPPRAAEQML